MKNNSVYNNKIALNILRDILFFPIWWYSFGLYKFLLKLKEFLTIRQKSLALFVWMKNIFVPMYGQYNIAGRIISFFMRLVQIIFRGLIMIFWLLFSLILLLIWIIIPIYTVYQIIFQI